jgi:hypothetical protein
LLSGVRLWFGLFLKRAGGLHHPVIGSAAFVDVPVAEPNGHVIGELSDLQVLHDRILQISPGCKLWFLDGKNDVGKIVSNPNIGYGLRTIKYADGTLREFFQIGLSTGQNRYLCLYPRYRRQEIPGRNIRQHPRGRDRLLHTVQNSKRYKHRRPRSGDCVWV